MQLARRALSLARAKTGNRIAVSTTITGGILISNTSLHDASTNLVGGGVGGDLFVDSTLIKDADDADLTVAGVGVDVSTTGLVIGLQSIGSANGIGIYEQAVRLGSSSAAPIGDVAITGLQLSGTTITVSGHYDRPHLLSGGNATNKKPGLPGFLLPDRADEKDPCRRCNSGGTGMARILQHKTERSFTYCAFSTKHLVARQARGRTGSTGPDEGLHAPWCPSMLPRVCRRTVVLFL